MVKENVSTGESVSVEVSFSSLTAMIFNKAEVSDVYDMAIAKILQSFSNYQKNGSGWRFESVLRLVISIEEYNPLVGGSYSELPPNIKNKGAIINIKNTDDHNSQVFTLVCDKVFKSG
jgi:hypothetical protein